MKKLLVFLVAAVMFTGCAADDVDFDGVAAAFRDAGYIVIGPLTVAGTTTLSASRVELGTAEATTTDMFSLTRFRRRAEAEVAWAAAGHLIEASREVNRAVAEMWAQVDLGIDIPPQPDQARGRSGNLVWYGTPNALAVFEGAR